MLSQNFGGVAETLAPDHAKFSAADVPDLTGKVAVITGGSEGTFSTPPKRKSRSKKFRPN